MDPSRFRKKSSSLDGRSFNSFRSKDIERFRKISWISSKWTAQNVHYSSRKAASNSPRWGKPQFRRSHRAWIHARTFINAIVVISKDVIMTRACAAAAHRPQTFTVENTRRGERARSRVPLVHTDARFVGYLNTLTAMLNSLNPRLSGNFIFNGSDARSFRSFRWNIEWDSFW